jgi:hypothetical protein
MKMTDDIIPVSRVKIFERITASRMDRKPAETQGFHVLATLSQPWGGRFV